MTIKKKVLGVVFMPVKWVYLIVLILVLIGGHYFFYPKIESFFIFFPSKPFDLTPEALRLKYKDVYFTTEDGKRLHGWLFPVEGDNPVVIHLHGNAGNISHRLDLVSQLLKNKLQVFLIDYRGFGKSEGRPSEKGLYMDGVAAYDHLVRKEGMLPRNIVLHGHSIGAAVAVEVALNREVRSVILESAFTSTRDMAKTMPLFRILSPLFPANYANLQKISHLHIPKLIIHGGLDEIVPFSMGERLFNAAKEPKYFLCLKGAGHNDTYVVGGESYFSSFTAFAKDSKI
jgi:fermentation-respiration switch protein FrsA (DUF1100 family)